MQSFLSVRLGTNRVAEDGLGVVCGGPERRLPALGRRPGGGALTGAVYGGSGGAGAVGEAHRHHRGCREGVRPLTSGGHDLDGPVACFCSNFQFRRISVACLSWNRQSSAVQQSAVSALDSKARPYSNSAKMAVLNGHCKWFCFLLA